jgi:FKBP-type peptidyl-prolyl cis-trans isomerase
MPRTTALLLTLAAALAAPLAGCVGARGAEAAQAKPSSATARGPRVVPAGTDADVRRAGPEVRVRVRSKGDGPAAVTGSVVCLHYEAFVDGRDEPFASTRGLLEPLSVTLGAADRRLIPGFQRGLVGLRPGARARIEVPPELAYGKRGSPEIGVPPDATLTFEVEVLTVR